MPEIQNFTPFINFRYYSSDRHGKKFGVVIVKATYEIAPSRRLLIAEEQAPMMFTDACRGAVNETSLWHPSDMAPHKPRADVIVNAIARAPFGKPISSWRCGVAIERDGERILSKPLVVTGPRDWRPKWRRRLSAREQSDWRRYRREFLGWELSEPQPIAELPLHYEYAFGGVPQTDVDAQGNPVYGDSPYNPLGRGWLDREWTDHTQPQPAPQIMGESDPPLTDPYANRRPQNLGPIPRVWEPRLPLGGTYNQNWIDTIWPNFPPDYDFAYHNSAHPDLIAPDFLRGDERVTLEGLFTDEPIAGFSLPGDKMKAHFIRADGSGFVEEMKLDTLFLDIAEPRLREGRIYLSWRLNFPPDVFNKVVLEYIPSVQDADAIRAELAARNIPQNGRRVS